MLLFSPQQIVKGRVVLIPQHIRAALGFHSGLEVYLSTLEASDRVIKNEILVSPVPIKARGQLWRLRATFQDRPGILSELLGLLEDERIQVIYCRSHTIEQNELLTVELQLNADLSNVKPDSGPWLSAAGPTLPDLRSRILARFIEDIDFPFLDKPMLSIRRNIPLFRSKTQLDEAETAVLTATGVMLPRNITDSIRDSFAQRYPNILQSKGKTSLPLASVVGDVENVVARILIYYRNTGHIHIRVVSRNRPECLSTITEALRKRNFNILRMYSRVLNSREEVMTDFLLHLQTEVDVEKQDRNLKRYIFAIFAAQETKKLDCKLRFPSLLRGK
jgi:glycine cleavage system regulatory protein